MDRLDQLLVNQKLCDSRNRAQRMIKQGKVRFRLSDSHEWSTASKPSLKLPSDVQLSLELSDEDRFVSRAGLKLEGILSGQGISLAGHSVLDIGCSTGGFSDCALQYGADRVVGIDVGHGQLHPTLLNNPKMVLREGVNARNMPFDELLAIVPGGFDTIVMDVSFISQTLILPNIQPLLKPSGQLISLVKPQFEVGKAHIGKGGIVRDTGLFTKVAAQIQECCAQHLLTVRHYEESQIQGSDGNREFLLIATPKTN
ncbi:TlyA family RNA methyltransferase [Umboniibacter marinipuniceus]|uniref:23S rRNA (Cytidine1920-2'-O)/16S rRNA (Cytidine1409-2'-O)-methyltransferase n=1 Tax=Umboniibacter marinipuniceus TaxID=569599 RepID=A0A3M0A7A4_9GAMM|nr:TlyA family RNA methyltransferase [Umboniibacter marinipuniceus]RMA79419.1 23S rRNA (cytidine1920-2'-O)/16S rRNA (cytidine1409-2'-O)-methyltransferase [Umboniibacter marinipuniceus]